ncbi:ABC transporter ATP-binding protein [Ponticaulis sp.]|uniref:ABC transporter ATP-binding protein n=1 Tax=Ponticaulis sp. TaxID=2020902 RepID=UPI000B6859F9|nr:ABC transporter [Ponticaulis sp.]OUY00485.1 MAG: ABC transporter [Hyphomonadaceae bacterium TMED5]|tara:strand:- start:97405 stop:98112 length:708 start_codon:yes stop_codon:yes gene_type:complete
MMSAVLQLSSVVRTYRTGALEVDVLKGVDLSLHRGELVGLVGPSGSGKSTLLHTAGLLEKPDEGDVFLDGENCLKLNDRQRTLMRRTRLGFVYQFHHLLPEFTAVDNVAAPLYLSGVKKAEARERAEDLLERMGLSHRLKHQPMEMSGGEQQRVAIARALANRPKVLIADEPTGNLDTHTTGSVFQQLIEIGRNEGLAMLIATHNLALTKYMDRVLTLEDGQLTDFDVEAASSWA